MLVLLIAAMGKQNKDVCKGYTISIRSERTSDFFLDENDISALLKKAAKGNIKGQARSAVDLRKMEESLEKNVWVKDAQLFFDNKGFIHVSVTEREPVARIFTEDGNSFYLDENEQVVPLSDKAIAKVPVFTGFPAKRKWTKADSLLVRDIRTTAQFINGHSFWQSQVAQINIVPAEGTDYGEFEMSPTVGNHLIKLGNGNNIDKKFSRLFVFYKQVLASSGLEKYKIVDVRFAGQVVGVKGTKNKVQRTIVNTGN